MVASQNNHKGQIYNGTASPTLVEKDCWSVYEYTPCQLMLLSFALGYMYNIGQLKPAEKKMIYKR